jgi:uncharacterized damage-inducible protein DinB
MEFQIDQAVGILRRTPLTLDALLGGLPDEWLSATEGADTWSPFDVVGHLIHAEETDWIPRARIIIAHGEAQAFEPFDRSAMFEKSKGMSMDALLDSFGRLREENLAELKQMNLTDEALDARGKHPDLGTVTLKQLLATWVVHDLSHVGQIVRVMAKQYGEAVGPWQAYLSVLSR